METPAVINAIVTQLQQALPELATQFMPFCPPTFAPDEPRDTVVLSYPGSDFTPPQSTDVGVQIQTLHILATVITPEAHSPLNPLYRVRQVLGGLALAEGECPLWLVGRAARCGADQRNHGRLHRFNRAWAGFNFNGFDAVQIISCHEQFPLRLFLLLP